MIQPEQLTLTTAPTPHRRRGSLCPPLILPLCRGCLGKRQVRQPQSYGAARSRPCGGSPAAEHLQAGVPLLVAGQWRETRAGCASDRPRRSGRRRPSGCRAARSRRTPPGGGGGDPGPAGSHLLHRRPLPQRLPPPPPHSPGTRGTRTCRSCCTGSPRRGTARPAPPAAPAPPAPHRKAPLRRAAGGPPAPSRPAAPRCGAEPWLPRGFSAHPGGAGRATAREAGRVGWRHNLPAATGSASAMLGRSGAWLAAAPPAWGGPVRHVAGAGAITGRSGISLRASPSPWLPKGRRVRHDREVKSSLRAGSAPASRVRPVSTLLPPACLRSRQRWGRGRWLTGGCGV